MAISGRKIVFMCMFAGPVALYIYFQTANVPMVLQMFGYMGYFVLFSTVIRRMRRH